MSDDIASLYRLTDELPAKHRAEAIQHIRRVAAELSTTRQALAQHARALVVIGTVARRVLADTDNT